MAPGGWPCPAALPLDAWGLLIWQFCQHGLTLAQYHEFQREGDARKGVIPPQALLSIDDLQMLITVLLLHFISMAKKTIGPSPQSSCHKAVQRGGTENGLS